MTFLLETYLNKPRTFKGPLADYVARRVDHVNYFNDEISYVEFGLNASAAAIASFHTLTK